MTVDAAPTILRSRPDNNSNEGSGGSASGQPVELRSNNVPRVKQTHKMKRTQAHKELVQKSQIKNGRFWAMKRLATIETVNPPALLTGWNSECTDASRCTSVAERHEFTSHGGSTDGSQNPRSTCSDQLASRIHVPRRRPGHADKGNCLSTCNDVSNVIGDSTLLPRPLPDDDERRKQAGRSRGKYSQHPRCVRRAWFQNFRRPGSYCKEDRHEASATGEMVGTWRDGRGLPHRHIQQRWDGWDRWSNDPSGGAVANRPAVPKSNNVPRVKQAHQKKRTQAHKELAQRSQLKHGKFSALKRLVNMETVNSRALRTVHAPPNAGKQIPNGQDGRVPPNPPALLTVQVQPNQIPGRILNVQDGRVAASEPTPAAVQSGPNVMGAQRRENRQMPIRTPAAHLPIDSLQGYMFRDEDLVIRTKDIIYQPMTMYPISSNNHPYCLLLCLKTLRDGSTLKGVDENITNIRGLFQKLGFRVGIVIDPTATIPGRILNVQDGRVAASEPTPAAVQSGPNVMGVQRRENRQMPIRTPAAHLPIDSLQGYKFQDKDLVMRTKEIAYQPITMYPISSENRPYCLVLCMKTLRDGSRLEGAEENILNIRGVFGELGFRIFVVLDPTAKQIQTYLAQLGKRNDPSGGAVANRPAVPKSNNVPRVKQTHQKKRTQAHKELDL
ncbi:hypothetical protein B9Z55_008580 [Caenorhabditis nigoni]|nr:hypothetical protein B9Z55_008580 [Caenorhabditis nigoni]